MWWFFFFKQKTAYEIRKGDWSSDVCSSDLRDTEAGDERRTRSGGGGERVAPQLEPLGIVRDGRCRLRHHEVLDRGARRVGRENGASRRLRGVDGRVGADPQGDLPPAGRSEEH